MTSPRTFTTEKSCAGCGRSFTITSPNQRFCDPSCRPPRDYSAPRAAPREKSPPAQPRTVVLRLIPLKADESPALRLRRLRETARSLDLLVTGVAVEPVVGEAA